MILLQTPNNYQETCAVVVKEEGNGDPKIINTHLKDRRALQKVKLLKNVEGRE